MASELFGNKKAQPDDMERRLAQARRHLWRNELDKAQHLFRQIGSTAKEQIQKDRTAFAAFTPLHLQSQLGLWAIHYLREPEQRGGVTKLLAGQTVSAETAYFVAKVFLTRNDVSCEAMEAYHALLERDPSVNLARRVRDVVAEVSFSQTALALYIVLAPLLADDMHLMGTLCRWYLKANEPEQARDLAYHILQHHASHRDAHRCLAVLAEQGEDWETAIHHYRCSRDLLRLAVVLARANHIDSASQALLNVPDAEQQTSTWLYYRGWVAYQQHDLSSALEHWTILVRTYPQAGSHLESSLQTLRYRLLDQRLQVMDENGDDALDSFLEETDIPALNAWRGAMILLVHHDVQRSKPLLHQAAQANKDNVRIVSYLVLAQAQEKQDPHVDRTLYQQLTSYYHDASLFLWLRGLLLLKDQDKRGETYLRKAYHDGVCTRHIPLEAVQAVTWIARYLYGNEHIAITNESDEVAAVYPDDPTRTHDPFLWAVAPSVTLHRMQTQEHIPWIDAQPPTALPIRRWQHVQAAYSMYHQQWEASLAHIDTVNTQLRWRILSLAVQDALNQKDWLRLAASVKQGLTIAPDNQQFKKLEQYLRPQMHHLLWQRGELEILDYELEASIRSGKASPTVYHGLALVYTRLAMMKDNQAATLDHEDEAQAFTLEGHRTQARYTGFLEGQAHNDYWQLAIGYWAVVLSDDTYWKAWGARRSAIYGESIMAEQIRELVMSTIPRLLRTYHDDQVHTGSVFTAHHRFYSSIIEHEIEVTQAIRYVIRTSAHQKSIALPDYISQFMSPLLMKEYGYGEQSRQLVQRLEDARLSPYEVELLRSAFSPLSDIKALVSIHEYDMALGALRTYLAEQKYASMHGVLHHELARVLELAATQQLDRETWDTALQLAREGQRVQPENREFHHLAARAVIGQATRLFREEQYMDAIGELESVRSGLSYRHADLDTLLSETYTEWGYEAGRDGDHDTVIHRLTKALQMLPANARAQSGLHIAYYQRAIVKGQNGEYHAALEDAEAALRYDEEDAETLGLMAKLHRLIASDLDEAKNYPRADPHWETAIDCAAMQLDMVNTQESLHFLVEVGISRVLSFYASGRYTAAIELAEKMIATPYEPSAFKINLRELIAELYRDRAIGRAQDGEYHVALQDAQVAFQYYEHAGTLVLIARLHRSIAIELDEAGHFKQADPHWRTAIDCAARQLDMVNTQESLHFLVEVGISRVLSLYQREAYADAIDLAERLVTMPYEPSAFTVDLRALLSEMCTNYGAQIYNHGYQQQGMQLMRKALEYDSTNQVARNNLSLM